MNLEQHILIKFDEECSETAEQISDLIALLNGIQRNLARAGQRVTKALRFTLEEIQPGQERTNGNRLYEEIKDLQAAIDLLVEQGIIPPLPPVNGDDIARRKNKFQKYLIHSANNETFDP